MRKAYFLAFCALSAALLLSVPACADAVQGASSAGTADPSLVSHLVLWVFDQQRMFHRELTQGLRHLKAESGLQAASGLIVVSFLYGLLHAAGPGHGKAILTTYLLTHRARVAQGVRLAAMASACQGVTAILIVYGVTWLAGLALQDAAPAALWSERISYTLVLIVGAMLAVRSIRSLQVNIRQRRRFLTTGPTQAVGLSRISSQAIPPLGDAPPKPGGRLWHLENCGCPHCHTPTVEQIDGARDFRTRLGLILSIGLRPCTGAILVLVFSSIMQLPGAGIAAVMAMSAGTATAVASLAFLTVSARNWAARVSLGRYRQLGYAADISMMVGSAVLILLGLSLLSASFGPAHPMGMF